MHYDEAQTLLCVVGPRLDYLDAHLHDSAKEEEPITPPARGSGSYYKKKAKTHDLMRAVK